MRPDNAVPDVQLLKRFLLGKLSAAESEPIERYLEQHPDIASTLAELVKEDTLIGALRASTIQPVAYPPELVGLMDKLSQLRSAPVGDATVDSDDGKSAAAPSGDETFAGLAPAQGPDEIGRLGGYRVLKMLGAGGMGMVYQAEDVHLQRAIALKVMKAEVAKNPGNRERFLREARAAAKLKSDHVVTIHQVGEDRQVVFLAMEYLEGMSLDDWLKKGRKPSLAQSARIGRQIALGLADAHACGLIHRDIKPGNIWLDNRHQGRVKLLDFGLARGTSDEVHLTQSGAIVGTPAYMAPEQARGEKVDHRVDLFSLGVVLYRLTTGQLPFRGDNTMSILTALALDTPKPPREINADIPPRMASLIERLLSKDREQRPKTARAVADELASIEREVSQTLVGAASVSAPVVGAASVSAPVVGAASVSAPVVPTVSLRSRIVPRLRYGLRKYVVAASLLLFLGGVAAAIVVIVHDKDGNKVAEVNVPPGGSVTVEDKGKDEAKKPPAAKVEVRIEPAALPPLTPSEPLSARAFVQQPAKLPGVRSWSIATREMWNPSVIAYRPDGQRLAVGSWDGSVRVWEAKTGSLMRIFFVQGGVISLAWSPDGRILTAGGSDKVHLWDADSGRLLRRLETPVREWVTALAWSPDGLMLRGWGNSHHCYTWEVAEGKRLPATPIPCPNERPAFSPDGKRLAGTVDDNHLVIWDTESGKEISRLTAPAALWRASWSPDGKRLACPAKDGLHVWDVKTRKIIFSYPKVGRPDDPPAWSPDGRRLAFNWGTLDGTEVIELAENPQPRLLEQGGSCWLAWSPDGTTIVRINGEPHVWLHDAATGKRTLTLTEGGAIFGFAWSPDDKTLAVSERYHTSLVSADTGQGIADLKQKDWPASLTAWPIAWSPDGKVLAAQGLDNAVQLWNEDGNRRLTLAEHKAELTSLAWSPDGKRLASTAKGEKRVLIWDAAKGERDRELGPFAGAVENVKWSADGRLVTFNVPEVGWHVWDIEKNRLVNDPKQWKVFWSALTPDGRSALTVPSEKEVYRLRDLSSGKDGARLPQGTDLYLAKPTWSPDGRQVALSTLVAVEVWRPDLSKRLRWLPVEGGVTQIAFSRDGKRLAGYVGERLYIWETETGRLCGIKVLGRRRNGLTITADGHYTGNEKVDRGIVVVVQKDDGTQELLEPADFEQKYGFKNDPNKVHLLQPLPPPLYPLPGMPMGPYALIREPAELPDANSWTIETVNARGLIAAVAYRPNGKHLATGGGDGTIRIWDTDNGKLVRMLVGDPVVSLSWSNDGKILAVASGQNNGETALWDADAGRLLRRIPFGALAAWSPKGRTLALRVGDTVQLWDAATEQITRTYRFSGYGSVPVWSPDGKTLAVGLSDKSVRLWDVTSGKETRKLEGHEGVVVGVAWSPDGKRLVSVARSERAFCVWDAASGKLEGRFAVENVWDMEAVVAWSPDGKTVALGFNHAQGPNGLFDPATGHPLRSLDAGPYVSALAWSPDGKQMATAGSDGVRLHDAASGKRTHTLEEGHTEQQFVSLAWSPDSHSLALREKDGRNKQIVEVATGRQRPPEAADGWKAEIRSPDGRMRALQEGNMVRLDDANGFLLGALLPLDVFGHLAVTADGRYRGNARVERLIRMVVQKRDGTSETLTPSEFEQKYGFKNESDKVRLTDK